jgi:hypothetical protein
MRYVRHTLQQRTPRMAASRNAARPPPGAAGGEPPARPGSAQLTVAPRDCREA